MVFGSMSEAYRLLPQGNELVTVGCEELSSTVASNPLLLDREIQSGNQPVDPFNAKSRCTPALSFETKRIKFSGRNDNLLPA